ncbi:MAG: hypothetical protein GY711_29385 [bacterium]|nr:hypothetical protein [bacterium]
MDARDALQGEGDREDEADREVAGGEEDDRLCDGGRHDQEERREECQRDEGRAARDRAREGRLRNRNAERRRVARIRWLVSAPLRTPAVCVTAFVRSCDHSAPAKYPNRSTKRYRAQHNGGARSRGRPICVPRCSPLPPAACPARSIREVAIARWSELEDRTPTYALVEGVDLIVVRYGDAVSVLYVGNNTYSFGRYFECKRNAVSVSGYGGLGQYLAEITTLVKYRMNVTHVLVDNAELGKISKEQRAGEWDVWKTDLHNPDFARFAENCGALGIRVESKEEVGAAIARAIAHDGPALVEVMADPQLI